MVKWYKPEFSAVDYIENGNKYWDVVIQGTHTVKFLTAQVSYLENVATLTYSLVDFFIDFLQNGTPTWDLLFPTTLDAPTLDEEYEMGWNDPYFSWKLLKPLFGIDTSQWKWYGKDIEWYSYSLVSDTLDFIQ